MQMVQASIGWEFQVKLICLSDGTVMLVPQHDFGLIIDQKEDGVSALFDGSGFTLVEAGKEPMDYQYHTPYKYKEMPLLKAWLVQQELVSPI